MSSGCSKSGTRSEGEGEGEGERGDGEEEEVEGRREVGGEGGGAVAKCPLSFCLCSVTTTLMAAHALVSLAIVVLLLQRFIRVFTGKRCYCGVATIAPRDVICDPRLDRRITTAGLVG